MQQTTIPQLTKFIAALITLASLTFTSQAQPMSACVGAVACTGTCSTGWTCMPRILSHCLLSAAPGTKGDWGTGTKSCGKCTKTILGIRISGADCGDPCLAACFSMLDLAQADIDKPGIAQTTSAHGSGDS